MDPDACYQAFINSIEENEFDEATHARDILLGWLAQGGFEPDWSIEQKEYFLSWNLQKSLTKAQNTANINKSTDNK